MITAAIKATITAYSTAVAPRSLLIGRRETSHAATERAVRTRVLPIPLFLSPVTPRRAGYRSGAETTPDLVLPRATSSALCRRELSECNGKCAARTNNEANDGIGGVGVSLLSWDPGPMDASKHNGLLDLYRLS